MARIAGSLKSQSLPAHALGIRIKVPETFSGTGAAADLLEGCPQLAALVSAHPHLALLLDGVFAGSPYLAGLIERDPPAAAALLATDPDRWLDALLDGVDAGLDKASDEPEAGRIVRQAKAHASLAIALADIGGVWDVEKIIAVLSRVARRLVGAVVGFALKQAAVEGKLDPANSPENSGFFVLAMGKLGANELNYSSDIDLIVLFDPELASVMPDHAAQKVFVGVTRAIVRLLHERTADGYVYRTDLRLRPDPGATNLAMSTTAALLYYESLGQNWERAAMIKARAIAGDVAAGARFLAELVPFIWRKYLDFAAISDVHSIKRQINAYRGFTQGRIAGHNIKLGHGGIREIEFFVQTQQLIAGGRQKNLRARQTLKALGALARQGWINGMATQELSDAYRFLRGLENRLQMVADEQTQTLPKDQPALERFAHFAGYPSVAALDKALSPHLKIVERHYAALFEKAPELGDARGHLVFTGGEDDPETLETLSAMGFDDARLVSQAVREWHYGRRAATRSPAARQRLTELMPALLAALAATQNPAQAFIAFDRFLTSLPAGVQLFALLRANPNLLSLIADIMGTAPRLAHQLSQRPRTLEAVLDPAFLAPLPSQADYRASAQAALSGSETMEDLLDRARAFGQEQFFRVGLRLLSASLSADEAGAAYAGLAAGLLAALLAGCEAQLATQVGQVAGSAVVVLAMGKFGGREMSATSDLDLILIYDTEKDASQTDGAKPVSANQYFTRLTQRLIAALSVPTAEGRLYEVDMRLRPSGQKGPVATRLAAFRDYQNTSAQTWEKMALTRARVVAGSPALAAQVEPVIRQVLCARRSERDTARDVVDMRNRIEREKATSDIWQIKQVRGGLVDIEFIVQYLQLIHAGDHPEILSTNTGVALARLAGAGLIAPGLAEDLRAGLALYQNLAQLLRLCLPPPCDPSDATLGLKQRLANAVGLPDFAILEAELRTTQARIYQCFKQILEGE